jgi:hypothetical protein
MEEALMDPISIAALTSVLTALFEGATEEAGAKTLDSLGRLLRRARRGRAEEPQELERWATNPGPADAGAIAAYLSEAAAKDVELARQLEAWVAEARMILAGGSVANTVTGLVTGNVIQGRNIGSIRLG